MSKYFEDFNIGDVFESPGVTLTESSIIEFALKYDPQRFHTHVEAAKQSPYGGLIASGFHTLCVGFRMFAQLGVIAESSLGSPGIEDLRWLKPVRPGDTLHTRVTIQDARESKSRPDRGILTEFYEVFNQNGEAVMTYRSPILVAKAGR